MSERKENNVEQMVIKQSFYFPHIKCKEVQTNILRIKATRRFTRIDFGSTANTEDYVCDWWTNISLHSFIRLHPSEIRLPLRAFSNIPIKPQKYFYKHKDEVLLFSLFFDSLPVGTTSLDFIEGNEEETLTSKPINLYGIELSDREARIIEIIDGKVDD